MSWITRVLHSNHCHQWLKPTYTMTTSGAGDKLGRGVFLCLEIGCSAGVTTVHFGQSSKTGYCWAFKFSTTSPSLSVTTWIEAAEDLRNVGATRTDELIQLIVWLVLSWRIRWAAPLDAEA